MRLLFVADGPRDRVTIPEIVGQILGAPPVVEFQEWKGLRLQRSGGYARKLRFALLRARDLGLDGVVATVDSDDAKPKSRLKLLHAARHEDRQNTQAGAMPTALGEAVPHLEAWLLDDPKAVKGVLRFPSDKLIPDVLHASPKSSLDELIDESDRTDEILELLAEIAKAMRFSRCNHSSDTGLDEFIADVHAELKPTVPPA